jgi:hypothetical protein
MRNSATSSRIIPCAARGCVHGEGIDAHRACGILGVSYGTLGRMVQGGMLEWADSEKLAWKRVRYYSIVEFCDRLRRDHSIRDRRLALSPGYVRHRDEDLLPFQLRDTMTAQEALSLLGLAKLHSLVRLHRNGCFDAYQFSPQAAWRVSRSSLLSYLKQPPAHGGKVASKHECSA